MSDGESESESDSDASTHDTKESSRSHNHFVKRISNSELLISGPIGRRSCVEFTLVMSKMTRELQLLALNHVNFTPKIRIRIMSNGGLLESGFAMADIIQTCPLPVTTIVQGNADSAASIIFVSATDRALIMSNATILIHQLRSGTIGTFTAMQDDVSNCHKSMEMMRNFYEKQCPNLSKKTLKELFRSETMLTSTEAITEGIADDYFWGW